MKTCYYHLATGRTLAVEPHSEPDQYRFVCRDSNDAVISRWVAPIKTWDATPDELRQQIMAKLADYDPPERLDGGAVLAYPITGNWKHGRYGIVKLVPTADRKEKALWESLLS